MSNESKTIHLRDALRLMDESLTPDGTTKPFSISFYRYSSEKPHHNGSNAAYTNCIKAVIRQNMSKNMQRGIRLLNSNEIKTVNIWLINEFNGHRVRW